MKANRLRASAGLIALAAAAGSPAHAGEEPSVTWLWEVTTDDGDALVEPGETASITLSADMEPSVGEPGQTDGFIVVGINFTMFDTLGGPNADRGAIAGWQVLNDLDFLFGDTTTTDGVSLFNTQAGQAVGSNLFFSGDDPVDILTFTWETEDFSTYSVEYMTSTASFFIGEGDRPGDLDDGFPANYVNEANIQFAVVPPPPTTVILLILPLWRKARQRAQMMSYLARDQRREA